MTWNVGFIKIMLGKNFFERLRPTNFDRRRRFEIRTIVFAWLGSLSDNKDDSERFEATIGRKG